MPFTIILYKIRLLIMFTSKEQNHMEKLHLAELEMRTHKHDMQDYVIRMYLHVILEEVQSMRVYSVQ